MILCDLCKKVLKDEEEIFDGQCKFDGIDYPLNEPAWHLCQSCCSTIHDKLDQVFKKGSK